MVRRTFTNAGGERCPLQARSTAALRDRLQAAANFSGRSLAQEIEARLERSFAQEDITAAVREEFARYRADTSVMPNMRDEDRAEWLKH